MPRFFYEYEVEANPRIRNAGAEIGTLRVVPWARDRSKGTWVAFPDGGDFDPVRMLAAGQGRGRGTSAIP